MPNKKKMVWFKLFLKKLFSKKFKIDLKIFFKLKSINNMLSNSDLEEIEKTLMNENSQYFIKCILFFVGALIIVYLICY